MSFCISIISWVYCEILTDPGMILNWWWKVIKRLPEWVAKPLGTCVYCFSGQVALWFYLWFVWRFDLNYNIFQHIFLISITIFIVKMINKWN